MTPFTNSVKLGEEPLFTKEIKEAWLTALKSGVYTQGYTSLLKDNRHCCIGVLADIVEQLSNNLLNIVEPSNQCPYLFLENNIGRTKTRDLWGANDRGYNCSTKINHGSPNNDYSNVIPIIEKLKVQN